MIAEEYYIKKYGETKERDKFIHSRTFNDMVEFAEEYALIKNKENK